MALLTARGAAASIVLTSLVALAGSLGPVSAFPATAPRLAGPTGLSGQTDRQAVIDQYVSTLIPALDTPTNWNGSTASCNPGSPQPAEQQATLTAINYMRSLVGVALVSLSPDLSTRALDAATMMAAQWALSHNPGPEFACYTPTGAAAASNSNLSIGSSGAQSIADYMEDWGSNNTSAGHRRWIIDPRTRTMGSGSTDRSNALWVINHEDLALPVPADAPTWLPWPSAGYFPAQLEPRGRWSLSASDNSVEFDAATVSMLGPRGGVPIKRYPVTSGYGPNSIIWDLVDPLPFESADIHYSITVSNITRAGEVLPPVSYDVTLVRAPFTQTAAPTISGTVEVGQTLRATTGGWLPSPTELSVFWTRNGEEISQGSSYKLTKWDAGMEINANILVSRPYFPSATGNAAAVKVPGIPLMRPTSTIRLDGVPAVGRTLKVLMGHIQPSPKSIKFRWFRDGKRLRGATTRKYRVRKADTGHKVRAVLTARRDGYRDLRVTTKPLLVRR